MNPDPATPAGGGPAAEQGFRLAVVPGAQPQRWLRTWRERLPDVPLELLAIEVGEQTVTLATAADAGLVRLPVDRERFEAIPLYTETTVVVVPKDHLLAAGDELSPADLVDQVLLVPVDDVLGQAAPTDADRPATTAAAVELVAAGVGVLLVPQSLARLHHRRDLTYRVVTDEPTSTMALAWRRDEATELVQELIGIVRGRTANSSRGRGAPATGDQAGSPEAPAPSTPRSGGTPRRGTPPTPRVGAARRRGGPARGAGRGKRSGR